MEYISDFTVEKFWKEHYNLAPKGVLKKAGARWRHEIINETFKHFTNSSFGSNGKFKTIYKIPHTGEIKTKVHSGVTGYTSITSMKKLILNLNQIQKLEQRLAENQKPMSHIKQDRLSNIKMVREREIQVTKSKTR